MKSFNLCAWIALAAVSFGCSEDQENARIVVRLTDSPGDYEKVNIDLQDIQVNSGGGWVSLGNVNTGVYNLLDFTDGRETVLTNSTYPAGKVTQIRLLLGENNSVEIDGDVFPMKTPSAQQSGLKLLLNKDLVGGITYAILLDFDAAKSVVHTGNDQYILKPVIKVVSEAQDGAIEGTVSPAELNVAVYAISGIDTAATSYIQAGAEHFFLGGLPTGSYTVSFDPGELSGYEGGTINDVGVIVGEVTSVGNTTLSPL